MKIDDIPLPPVVHSNGTKIEKIDNIKFQSTHNKVNNNFLIKRVVNHKLPLGLLLKDSFCKSNESVTQKKELYLPTTNDKIPITTINSKPALKEISTVFSKSYQEQNKSTKTYCDLKVKPKRRSQEKEDSRETKRRRFDRISRERKAPKHDSRVRSQAHVHDFNDSRRNIESRHNKNKNNHHNYTRDRRRSPDNKYSKRKTYFSPRRRRSSSRRQNRHSSNRYHYSTERNGLFRDREINVTSRYNQRNTLNLEVSNKRRRSYSKKSSLASSKFNSSSSSSSSDSSNIELPLVSPKSPDESQKIFSECVKSNKESSIRSPVQRPIIVAAATNVYLKQLKDTLDKINVAYKTVVAQIPDQKNCTDVELSNIPLPTSIVLQDHTLANNVINMVGEISPINNEPPSMNGLNAGIRDHCRMAHSNSINVDKLSCITDSTNGSKVYRSPLHSFNVSSYSKESENSDIKSRPVIPKIVNFHINYSSIDSGLLTHCSRDFFKEKIHCHCTMPNPDQWTDHGVRACGQGQSCVLSQLKVECNTKRCPTEALCNNCQFQKLNPVSYKTSKAELFFDARQSLSWKLRARSKVQRNKLLFEVGGKAEIVNYETQIGDLKQEIFITKHIKMSLKSDPQSLVYYLRQGGAEEANVSIEKWLVNGHVRVGVFALCDIPPKTELVMFYRDDCLDVMVDDRVSLDSSEALLSTIKSLVHYVVPRDKVISILDQLLCPSTPAWVLDGCVRMGAVPLLYISSQGYLEDEHCDMDILTKLVDLLLLLVESCQYNIEKTSLGMDWSRMCAQLLSVVQSPDSRDKIERVTQSLITATTTTNNADGSKNQSNSNLYTLNCRLPTFWCSRDCQWEEEARVFFYHRVTKTVQWDMPVYPWETDDNDNDDYRHQYNDEEYCHMYDYNEASTWQVTHDEIAHMYLSLNKMYEMKQRRIMLKENNNNTKKPPPPPSLAKDKSESLKKDQFKKKMTDFIVRLLKPYRETSCRQGRITSDDDLRYLANKLSQTILFKELKILNNKVDYLEVTNTVESKTKSYVSTYLQSRGTVYQRPGHQTQTVIATKTMP